MDWWCTVSSLLEGNVCLPMSPFSLFVACGSLVAISPLLEGGNISHLLQRSIGASSGVSYRLAMSIEAVVAGHDNNQRPRNLGVTGYRNRRRPEHGRASPAHMVSWRKLRRVWMRGCRLQLDGRRSLASTAGEGTSRLVWSVDGRWSS